ncbi:MAG: pyridoxal phosphate-dependent aminotransferase [Lachnospiraceae bacterium]|nr:pyridoxal phosphate-dependent aminotransferase [Lachnospiraceae bacterium]
MESKRNRPTMQISDRVKEIPEALSIYINNIVYQIQRKGEDVTVLSLGEAYFDIPYFGFDDLDIRKGCHYSESRGLPELREKIAGYYKERYGAAVDADKELLISAGSKPLIFMALQAVLNSGDEVLLHEPAWLSYSTQIKLAGGEPRYIPCGCPVERFADYIGEKTRVLILNNPNNPAGRVYTRQELSLLYQEFRSRGVYLLVDEAYSDFVQDGSFASMAQLVPDRDGLIVVNSLSKNLGISGWRVGYVIAQPELIFHILKLNQHLITCAPTLLLIYLAEHFDEMLEATLPQARAVTDRRCGIERYARSKGLATMGGSATFYLFVSIGSYRYSSLDFAMYLLFRYHISVVPGSAYGESTERYVRLSVGTEPDEEICRAIDIIHDVSASQEFDGALIEESLAKYGLERFCE